VSEPRELRALGVRAIKIIGLKTALASIGLYSMMGSYIYYEAVSIIFAAENWGP
jgi:hypothetical protein